MLRKGLLILGGALALLSVVGLAVDRHATLLWFVVMAAMLSIGSAFIIEDEHALGISRGAAPAVIGLGLMAVFVVGLAWSPARLGDLADLRARPGRAGAFAGGGCRPAPRPSPARARLSAIRTTRLFRAAGRFFRGRWMRSAPRTLSDRIAWLADRVAREPAGARGDWLTRFVVLRLLGLVYLMAFLTLVDQGPALLGPHGLLPVDRLPRRGRRAARLARRRASARCRRCSGSAPATARCAPWLGRASRCRRGAARLRERDRARASCARCRSRSSTSGRPSTAFGWEIQLVETGFLCIFLCPLLDGRPFPRRPPPPAVDLAAALARRRASCWAPGSSSCAAIRCWRDLTCLDFHFETQPIPSPLTPLFHFLPPWAHAAGRALQPRRRAGRAVPRVRPAPRAHRRGALMAALQVVLILSGNLSFLNWLTLVPIARLLRRRRLAPAPAARGSSRAPRARARRGHAVARAGR